MATYTSTATGLWSAGATWVSGVKPPSAAGHKIVIAAGHTVTYDEADGTYGDNTSSTTVANNGIVVHGTLKASRATSTILRCAGTLYRAAGGVIDWGTSADPIPGGVTATVYLNHGSTTAGQHGLHSYLQTGGAFYACGVERTRNTRLSSSTAAGATSITVDDSDNWAVGDILVIAPYNRDPTTAVTVTISGGSAPTWTLSGPIAVARNSGTRVGNLTSNVTFASANSSYPANVGMLAATTDTTTTYDVRNVAFSDLGSATGWATVARPATWGVGLSGYRCPAAILKSCAVYSTAATPNRALGGGYGSFNQHLYEDIAIYGVSASYVGMHWGDGAKHQLKNCVCYRAVQGFSSTYEQGVAGGLVYGGEYWGSQAFAITTSIALTVDGPALHNTSGAFSIGYGRVTIIGADIDSASCVWRAVVAASAGNFVAYDCTYSAEALGTSMSGTNPHADSSDWTVVGANGDDEDFRRINYYRYAIADTATRKRSAYAVKIQPKVANTAITYTFTLTAVSGVAQTIKGSLRFDSTYGTATPPSIALSGQGVTASFTAPATADAWHDFTLTFTPTSTGDITATVTVQSTSTSGFAWLDGVYHYPMTQSVRHYGYQWLPQAAQIVDTRLTLSESAALALPVAVDHDAETITVSATAREVFEHCIADLCQTANQGKAVHISSATGDTFTTTYTVIGTVVGPYTDAAGLHVSISAAAIVSGTRVQLYNVTDSTEIYNGVLASTGLTYATTWAADKTIRLRADHPDYLPLEATGILTASGLTFLSEQAEDTVYIGNGIDGSTVTEFSADGLNIQVDVDDPDGYTLVQRLYAWMQYYQTTSTGIASAFFGAMSASDSANYTIDQDKADILMDNVSASPLMIVGGYLTRRDGTTVIAATSGSIQMDPGRAYVAPGGAAITVPEGERVITMASSGAHYARG